MRQAEAGMARHGGGSWQAGRQLRQAVAGRQCDDVRRAGRLAGR